MNIYITNQIVELIKELIIIIIGFIIDYWTVFSTLILAVVAIFGDQIKIYFFRPKIIIANDDVVKSMQTNKVNGSNIDYCCHRIRVVNSGSSAKNVQVYLKYKKLPLGDHISFITAPLLWTNSSDSKKDIASNDSNVYVELCYKKIIDNSISSEKHNFRLAVPWMDVVMSEDSKSYNENYGNIILDFFDENQNIGSAELAFDSKNDTFTVVKPE